MWTSGHISRPMRCGSAARSCMCKHCNCKRSGSKCTPACNCACSDIDGSETAPIPHAHAPPAFSTPRHRVRVGSRPDHGRGASPAATGYAYGPKAPASPTPGAPGVQTHGTGFSPGPWGPFTGPGPMWSAAGPYLPPPGPPGPWISMAMPGPTPGLPVSYSSCCACMWLYGDPIATCDAAAELSSC